MNDWRNHPQASAEAPWPYNIGDAVTSVHFAGDRDCPYVNPDNCPDHHRAERYVTYYKEWLRLRGIDVDELLERAQRS